jgi:spore maturation protein CgeB
LFEAAACGAPILSDLWPGLDEFFEPDAEILVADTTDEAVAAIERTDDELQRIARRARERTVAEHTALCRARQLEEIINDVGIDSSSGCGDADSAAGVL